MIAAIPYCNEEARPAPEPGLTKLMNAIRDCQPSNAEEAPSPLRDAVFKRIDREPARVETNLSGQICATNPAFSALCGYAFTEIRGKKPGSFLQGPGTDPNEVERIRAALRARQPVEVELVNYHKNGRPYRVKISIEPVWNDKGEALGFRATETRLD